MTTYYIAKDATGTIVAARSTENRAYTHAVVSYFTNRDGKRVSAASWSGRLDLAQKQLAKDTASFANWNAKASATHEILDAIEVDGATYRKAKAYLA